jgi:hypothetical protein
MLPGDNHLITRRSRFRIDIPQRQVITKHGAGINVMQVLHLQRLLEWRMTKIERSDSAEQASVTHQFARITVFNPAADLLRQPQRLMLPRLSLAA